jgi:hypothetical protein
MHNEFSNAVTNATVDQALFDLAVGDDWEVVDSATG